MMTPAEHGEEKSAKYYYGIDTLELERAHVTEFSRQVCVGTDPQTITKSRKNDRARLGAAR